jgi:hypothetical protein
MPKRMVSDPAARVDVGLSPWQAVGLPLGIAIAAFINGAGLVAAAVVLSVVIWSLTRLRSHAPSARSTSDLVGAVLGDRAATMTALLQVAAYLVLAAELATVIGLDGLLMWVEDPAHAVGWLWPPSSVAAVVLAGVAAYALSTRIVASICTVLAAAAALIVFYMSLAVIAKVLSGSEPMQIGAQPPLTGLGAVATVLLGGMSLVGIEVITVANSQTRSIARPMSWAIVIGVACAVLVWTADQLGASGGFRYDASQFAYVTVVFFGDAGARWLLSAMVCAGMAGLLAITWALVRVAGPTGERLTRRIDLPGDVATTMVLTPIIALIAVAVCRNWVGIATITTTVAAILLIAVYVLVAEASSRLPRFENFTWTIKVVMAGVLAAAVLIPLMYDDFAATALWRVAIATVLVASAAVIAARWPHPTR